MPFASAGTARQRLALARAEGLVSSAKFKVPNPASIRFQSWMNHMFDRDRAFAKFIKLGPREKSVKRYLKDISRSETAGDGCVRKADKWELQVSQAVVHGMCILRAKNRIDTPGLLVCHSTGAGKTLCGLSALIAFWNKPNGQPTKMTAAGRKPPVAVFMVSTKGNQEGNSLEKLAGEAMKYFSEFHNLVQEEGLSEYPFKNTTLQAAIKQIQRRLQLGFEGVVPPRQQAEFQQQQRTGLYTFGKLGNDIKKYFRGGFKQCLFVVDEVQFLLSPPSAEMSLKPQYDRVRHALQHRSARSTYCVAMTATPGETNAQVCEIMNAVAASPSRFHPSDVADGKLARKARGLVSYAMLTGDLSHFARLSVGSEYVPFGRALGDEEEDEEKVPKDRHPMYWEFYCRELLKYPQFRGKEWLEQFADEQGEEDGMTKKKKKQKSEQKPKGPDPKWTYDEKKKGSYYIKLREAADYIIVKRHAAPSAEKMRAAGQDFITTRDGRGDWTILISPKLTRLVQNIRKGKGKHYVYSSFPMTLMLIAHMLERSKAEKGLGLKQLTGRCVQREPCVFHPQPKQQYYVLLDDVHSTKSKFGGFAYKTQVAAKVQAAKDAYDAHDNNLTGKTVKVVLGTKESFKGVDLKMVQHLHLMEPMTDFADYVQFSGRGPRYCSHAQLAPHKRLVQLLLYRLTVPGAKCSLDKSDEAALADCHVFDQSRQRYRKNWLLAEQQLQKASVDYLLFKDNINGQQSKTRDAMMSVPDVQTIVKAPPQATASRAARQTARRLQLQQKREHQKARIAGLVPGPPVSLVVSRPKTSRQQRLLAKREHQKARLAGIVPGPTISPYRTPPAKSITKPPSMGPTARKLYLRRKQAHQKARVAGLVSGPRRKPSSDADSQFPAKKRSQVPRANPAKVSSRAQVMRKLTLLAKREHQKRVIAEAKAEQGI